VSDVLADLQQALGGGAVQRIASQLGTDHDTAQNAVSAALPLLLGALTRNAADPNGAAALHGALERDHADGGALNDIAGAITGHASGPGESILAHILGNRQAVVAQGVGQATGLGSPGAGALLSMLAPLVLGALGRRQAAGGLDAGGLAGMLADQQQAAPMPGALGALNRLLDADGDGSALDDVAGMVGKLFKK
jgi:hypothetical protein